MNKNYKKKYILIILYGDKKKEEKDNRIYDTTFDSENEYLMKYKNEKQNSQKIKNFYSLKYQPKKNIKY